MRTSNKIALGAAGIAVALLAAWAMQPRPVAVETARAVQGVFELTVSDDGRTRTRDRYTISAPLAGRVGRIGLRAGDPVEQGSTVAVLTPSAPAFVDARAERELRERLGAAEALQQRAAAESRRLEAQRDQARIDVERQSRLAKDGFISPTIREQAELQLRTAERALDGARFAEDAAGHEFAQARAALSRYRSAEPGARWAVLSPVKGTVLKVIQESEGAVALGAPLLEVADPRSLEAVVDIVSQSSVAIRPGMAARIELGQGAAPLNARVRLVEPAAFTKISALGVEEQRVNVVLDIVDPLDKIVTIGDGFRIDAHIVTQRVENAVKVPVGAVFRDGEGWAVFGVEGNRAAKRAITVSMRNGVEALVTGGVKAGETVVVYPSDALTHGSKVEVRNTSKR